MKVTKARGWPSNPTKGHSKCCLQGFNKQDEETKLEKQKRHQVKYQMLAMAIQAAKNICMVNWTFISQSFPDVGNRQTPRDKGQKLLLNPCFRCSKGEIWTKKCPNPHSPPRSCPQWGKEGHWKVDCEQPPQGRITSIPSRQPNQLDFNLSNLLSQAAED